MKIQWKIEKKRGNYRPVLSYVITLEEHEKDLAMNALTIESSIPHIPDAGMPWCMPGCNERAPGWEPIDFHSLSVPYFKIGTTSERIRLPFRESASYPEVEQSFAMLRDAYEKAVNEVYQWQPFYTTGEMDITPAAKEQRAATLTARKMLGFTR